MTHYGEYNKVIYMCVWNNLTEKVVEGSMG